VTTVGVVGLGHWGSKVVDEYVALREEGVIDGVVACDEDDGRLAAVNEVDDRVKDLNATIEPLYADRNTRAPRPDRPRVEHRSSRREAVHCGPGQFVPSPPDRDA